MLRLKDRTRQVPGGLKWIEAATRWQPQPYQSFDALVRQIIEHRKANMRLAPQNNWSIDYDEVAAEVDAYNARLCHTHGWLAYVVDDGEASPKSTARNHHQAIVRSGGRVVAGVKLLNDWLGEDGRPVAREIAEGRAALCADCPQNGKGDWTRWFTVPASNWIRKQLGIRQDMALVTEHDERLGVCEACGCPLKLKVHTPIEHVARHTDKELQAALDPRCWITAEMNQP